jgi:hypothetical protein
MINPLSLAIFDFVPSLAFALGGYYLMQILKRERPGTPLQLARIGIILVFTGGFLKALSKLLYYTSGYQLIIGGVDIMAEQQFFLLMPGFLLMLLALIKLARPSIAAAVAAAAPLGKLPFIAKAPFMVIMSLCAFGVQALLVFLSFKRRQYIACASFILAFLVLLWMAGMASGPQTVSREWLEETMNALGQLSFMAGCYLLNKRGLTATTATKAAGS